MLLGSVKLRLTALTDKEHNLCGPEQDQNSGHFLVMHIHDDDGDEEYVPRYKRTKYRCADRMCGADDCTNCNPSYRPKKEVEDEDEQSED